MQLVTQNVQLAILACVLLFGMLGGSALAQRSQLFPEWVTEGDAPVWQTTQIELSAMDRANLDITARSYLGKECATYEALRWDLRSVDLFLGPPIVDLDFYILMEEQHAGVTFLDVNLSVAYGITGDGSYAFYWNAPWGLWPTDGIFVEFFACEAIAP